MKNYLTLIFFIFSSIQLLFAQNKIYTTHRIENSPPIIDGLLDDPIWKTIDWEENFTQFEPHNSEKPSQNTAFKLFYDDNNLYLAVKAYDSEPEKIEKQLTRRDGWGGDFLGIQLDSYFDKKTAFAFIVTASGIKNDGIFNSDGDDFTESWDPIWFVKTSIDAEGWNAEYKIPLSQLRFAKKEKQKWGMQVIRKIYRNDELSLWQHIDNKESGWVSNFGELHGIENIKPKRQIEIAPFVLGKNEFYETEDDNPFSTGNDFSYNVGVDGKVGITNDLILDFTVNPDFGQVEADPSELNLSAFESYFSEKRPFFIEGKNITDYRITPGGHPMARDNLFYSRRIGKQALTYPDVSDDEYVKIPERTKIIGAFKLTGKTKNGWSIGIVESITGREQAEIDYNGERRFETIEPLTSYFIGRLQKDINKGNTVIGGIFTSTNRNFDGEDFDVLSKSANTAGLDFRQYWKDKKYYFSTKFVVSKIEGSEDAILEQQLSSIRYLQRPDADYLNVDSSLTSMSGHGGTILMGKSANSGLRYTFCLAWRSPKLELNDVGFLRQSDKIFHYLWIGYEFEKPFSIFRKMNINANEWAGWDFGGTNLYKGMSLNFRTVFTNLWSLGTGINFEGQSISNDMLRGGPSILLPGSWDTWLNLETNETKPLSAEIGYSINRGEENYYKNNSFWAGLSYRPSKYISINVSSSYHEENSLLQYVTNEAFEEEEQYIFANLDQKVFRVTSRIDINFTPNFSLQYYTSPFITGGIYDNFKNIIDPKASKLNERYLIYNSQISYMIDDNIYGIDANGNGNSDFTFDNPDFNFRQFRSNLVLRWEYSPGSVLFIVWSQSRTGSETNGKFDYKNDFKELFEITPYDVLLVKLSYRFRAEEWF
ncbi:MAG: carbohydrate binding family 9 domain-containing protein [Bacteroidetes bacterium]|jgi:hypothetical protein|nr:carbohydrate binding family 9 domain-containing protein [Bacteroidota bacterium]MBT6688095.1 carbohydrate binding family 9 domain-containing protein [Bacteroidota bacterium]MBT7144528.1 carbohydrate binding family 9 domain-containing protein [Bacteroidota bacterium]MBT7490347.1 carbohydrate binding family 9 domain-containing protein [Bacteroidota bacterium]